MKVLRIIVKVSFALALFFALQSMTISDGVIGAWEYVAQDTPPEYAKGEINISMEDDVYVVQLNIHSTDVLCQDVVVDGDNVSFSLQVEDARVKVNLEIDGDTFNGRAITYDGDVKLVGKRKK